MKQAVAAPSHQSYESPSPGDQTVSTTTCPPPLTCGDLGADTRFMWLPGVGGSSVLACRFHAVNLLENV